MMKEATSWKVAIEVAQIFGGSIVQSNLTAKLTQAKDYFHGACILNRLLVIQLKISLVTHLTGYVFLNYSSLHASRIGRIGKQVGSIGAID